MTFLNMPVTTPSMQIPDEKQILNKGLVVRVGRVDSSSKHTVCSKTTTNRNCSTTTTTKITIDLSPSPNSTRKEFGFTSNYPLHNFKSTSLILNTIKSENGQKLMNMHDSIPKELDALRKLYEDAMSDNEADKEVQSLMSTISDNELRDVDEECSSVVSGSWSKVSATRNVGRFKRSGHQNGTVLNLHAHVEKGTLHIFCFRHAPDRKMQINSCYFNF